jgi:membrane-bound lytic murein transglycosylase A
MAGSGRLFGRLGRPLAPRHRARAVRRPRPENIVHQTIRPAAARRPAASSKIRTMNRLLGRGARTLAGLAIVGMVSSCAVGPAPTTPPPTVPAPAAPAPARRPAAPQRRSPTRAAPAAGDPAGQEPLGAGALGRAAGLWTRRAARGLERLGQELRAPRGGLRRLCPEVRCSAWPRPTSSALDAARGCSPTASSRSARPADGLLTAISNPRWSPPAPAATAPGAAVPPAAGRLGARKPWYTRQEIDTLPEARRPCAGARSPGWRDPIDALMLQIQGSGRLRVPSPMRQRAHGAPGLCRHQRPALPERRPLAAGPGRCATPPGRASRPGSRRTRSACRSCCGATRARVLPRGAAGGPGRRPLARAVRRACR